MTGYWDATDRIMEQHGGHGPPCQYCGKPMYPQDDHGRFSCSCEAYASMERSRMRRFRRITQVTDVIPKEEAEKLTDEEKAKIEPLNRLKLKPTKKEADFFQSTLKAMQADMSGDPEKIKKAQEEYEASRQALDKERKKYREKD